MIREIRNREVGKRGGSSFSANPKEQGVWSDESREKHRLRWEGACRKRERPRRVFLRSSRACLLREGNTTHLEAKRSRGGRSAQSRPSERRLGRQHAILGGIFRGRASWASFKIELVGGCHVRDKGREIANETSKYFEAREPKCMPKSTGGFDFAGAK